jgi:type IV pilus assembly protein PilM
MRTTRVLTVDCGAAHVACGLFSAAAGRLVLERFGTRPVVPGELGDEDWVAAVGAVLRELGRLKGFEGECVLGLPAHLAFSRLIRVPPVSARQRRQILRFEERQGLPAALDEMVWSHATVSAGAGGEEVILAAAKMRMMTALGAQLRETGFRLAGAVPAWAGLRHALRHTHPDSAAILVLSIGARSAQLCLRGPSRSVVRTLALGGNSVTQNIAEGLKTDFAKAEAVKLKVFGATAEQPVGAPERTAAHSAVEQFVRRLCGEITRSAVLLPAEDGGRQPQDLLLAGGGSLLRGLPALLAEKLQVRVEQWEPWSRVGLGQAVAGLPGGTGATQAADLVGLAAWAVDREPSKIDLVPRSFRRERILCRRGPWLAGLLLVAVAGLLFGAGRYRSAAKTAQKLAREVDSNLTVLRRLEARNRANLGRLVETNRQISALQRLAASRSNWTGFLGDLQARLAKSGDVWLERLQVLPAVPSAAPIASAPGGGRSPGAGANEAAGSVAPAAEIRLHLAGSALDVANPTGRNGEESRERVKSLLASIRESPFVAGIEGERFDASQAGLLRFEVTVLVAPRTLF